MKLQLHVWVKESSALHGKNDGLVLQCKAIQSSYYCICMIKKNVRSDCYFTLSITLFADILVHIMLSQERKAISANDGWSCWSVK